MSEFWWGVLALPLIALVAAVGVAAVFGGWLLLEKWYEHRFNKMKPISLPRSIGGRKLEMWTLGDLGQRGRIAANVLTRPHAFMFQVFVGGGALIYVGGTPSLAAVNTVDRSLSRAVQEVAKEASKREGAE